MRCVRRKQVSKAAVQRSVGSSIACATWPDQCPRLQFRGLLGRLLLVQAGLTSSCIKAGMHEVLEAQAGVQGCSSEAQELEPGHGQAQIPGAKQKGRKEEAMQAVKTLPTSTKEVRVFRAEASVSRCIPPSAREIWYAGQRRYGMVCWTKELEAWMVMFGWHSPAREIWYAGQRSLRLGWPCLAGTVQRAAQPNCLAEVMVMFGWHSAASCTAKLPG
eukprot:1160998-Pelagomonas_calceolata.AAC.1